MAASRYGIERLRQQEMFNNMGGIDLNDPYGGINEPPQQRQIQYQPPPEINDPQGGINVGPEGPDIGSARPSGDIPNLRIQNIAPPEVPKYDQYEEARQLAELGNKLFTPSTKRFDEYTRVLDEFPEREDPSFARRLTASLVGFKGGTEAADKVLFGPYGRDLAEWKAHEEPLRQAATQEGQQNAQERQFTGNIVSNVAANRRVTQQEAEARLKAETAQQVADTRAQTDRLRIESTERIAQEKARLENLARIGWKFDYSGPTIIATSTESPEPRDTGIKTGNISDLDKITFDTLSRMAIEAARGAQDRQTQAAPRTAPGQNAPGDVLPGRAGTGGAAGTPPTGYDAVMQEQDKLNKAQYVPQWAEFVEKVGNIYRLKPPTPVNGWFKDTPVDPSVTAQYNAFLQFVYGDLPAAPQQQPPPAATPAPTAAPAPPQPKGVPGLVGGQQRYMQPPVPVPGTPGMVGGQQRYLQPETAAPTYKVYQQDAENPNNQRRSVDGVTFEYSTDGGKTWTK